MKKRIYSFLATLAILFLLSACFPEPPSVVEEEEPAEEIPSARTYYTLRFGDTVEYGGSESARESRALTREIAVAFHEFFEAVFVYNDGGTYRVARAAWNIGETPQLHGVHRPTPGTDYNYGGVGRNPASGGSALLFVGTGDDKTLLGLGRLIEVDDVRTTIIRSDSRSVTFEVAPLIAGVSTTAAASSFRTGASGALWAAMQSTTTIENNIYIHYNKKTTLIPLFNLDGRVDGLYNFAVDSTGAVNPANQNFDTYKDGIILKANGRNIEKRNPRYFVADGQYNYSSMFVQDTKTTVALQNNGTAGGPFENPVRFRFSAVPNDGSVFALVFEIFVHNLTTAAALSTAAAALSAGPAAERWRISPGIGSKWLDLDNGAGGEGGAILLGSGNVEAWLNNRPPE